MTTSVWTGSRRRDDRKQHSGDETEWASSVRFPKLQLEINDLVLTVTEEISRLHADKQHAFSLGRCTVELPRFVD